MGSSPASAPEASGFLAAQGLRDHLGLSGRPIGVVEEQLGKLGIRVVDSGAACTRERMPAGSRRGCGAAAVINRTPRTSTPWGKRLEAVRALGHLLMDPYRQDTIAAASTAFAQPRARRRAGAFAAEFLLPGEALRKDAHCLDSYAEPESFEHVMERYGVGARTAACHLWNRGFLSSSQVRDDLIDRFSGAHHRPEAMRFSGGGRTWVTVPREPTGIRFRQGTAPRRAIRPSAARRLPRASGESGATAKVHQRGGAFAARVDPAARAVYSSQSSPIPAAQAAADGNVPAPRQLQREAVAVSGGFGTSVANRDVGRLRDAVADIVSRRGAKPRRARGANTPSPAASARVSMAPSSPGPSSRRVRSCTGPLSAQGPRNSRRTCATSCVAA